MDFESYGIEHQVEQTHWWFKGRRWLFKKFISKLGLKKDAAILDIGSSSGTNLRMLKEMGFIAYEGMDISTESQKFCAEKALGIVVIADIQTDPINTNHYDLIVATDIIEHLEAEEAAVRQIFDAIKPGGHALITVPCFESIWGPQDVIANHLRRYKKADIEEKLSATGFTIKKSFYFNFLLFPPIYLVRKFLMSRNKIVNENTINSPLINFVLNIIFRIDCFLSPILHPPFGVSALILVQKP